MFGYCKAEILVAQEEAGWASLEDQGALPSSRVGSASLKEPCQLEFKQPTFSGLVFWSQECTVMSRRGAT
jgi:hypothetical protein